MIDLFFFFLTLTYSHDVLLYAFDYIILPGILRDVPDFPLLMIYNKERDAKRMALFPSLDYRGLYGVLVQLLEVTPLILTGTESNNFIPCLKNSISYTQNPISYSQFLASR